ncbi:hypothetical protein [Peribacillus frigoritolerans]|uniref:hypothetical protein n=1 Tax=Peribacillus frigoritolerans TaxID=450367 RepID=UPI002E1B87CA
MGDITRSGVDGLGDHTRYQSFIRQMRTPGVHKVGGLGACTLISQKALKAGVNFNRIENLSFWGEDRHFCIRAAALGISMYVDTHLPAYHIYREGFGFGRCDGIP